MSMDFIEKAESLPSPKELREHPELITPEVAQTITEIGEGLSIWSQAFVDWLVPVFEKAQAFIGSLSDTFYQIYLTNGAVYGETQEGCFQWWQEALKVDPEKARAKKEAYQEMCRAEMRASALEFKQKRYIAGYISN